MAGPSNRPNMQWVTWEVVVVGVVLAVVVLTVVVRVVVAFSVSTRFMMATVRGSGLLRGMPLVIRMQKLHTSRCGNQWQPGVHLFGCKTCTEQSCQSFGWL
jgi:hypothetical protein